MLNSLFDTVSIVPPHKIRKFIYLCDSRFHTEFIEDLFQEAENQYGVVMVFGEEAEFYTFDDKYRHKFVGRIRHSIANNHHRGGQSQNRLARLRTEQIHRYVTQVEESIRKFYTREGLTKINRLIISGPGMKKDQVKDRLKWLKCPISIYSDLDFAEICAKFAEIIGEDYKENSIKTEKDIDEIIRLDPDRLVFGEDAIRAQLGDNSLEKVWCKNKDNWLETAKTEIIQVVGNYLDKFGGCVGLRWLKSGEDTLFED